jgi:signal transduction histidine kinase
MVIHWGSELVQIYNDAAIEAYGCKHPHAMGQPARVNFPEFWERTTVERLVAHIRATGLPFRAEDQRLPMNRRGFREETYFTFALSPLLDDNGAIQGMLNTYIETTSRVLGGRRLATLRTLADRTREAGTVDEVCRQALAALAANPLDLRFVLLYLQESDATVASLAGVERIVPATAASPLQVPLGDKLAPHAFAWPIARVLRARKAEIEEDLSHKFDVRAIIQNRTPPERAIVLPLVQAGEQRAYGVLIVGLSARLVHDDAYLTFLHVVASQVAAAIAAARAHQAERERAEKLAELDRVKSVFYSNISHEFRTPLTLLLAPITDVLNQVDGPISEAQRQALETMRRNAVRLMKLVNGLLDFARIESGRMDSLLEPTDLAELTRELASGFELPARQAGLRLLVDSPRLHRSVLVDPEMWEKIVGNLLSNALKYTHHGTVEVTLRDLGDRVRFTVRDTGIGIAPEDLPHIFERFYRVRGGRGRSVEGAGIGLALVHELVRLYGGTTRVSSSLGEGTSIEVEISFEPAPAGAPAFATGAAQPGATPWIEEARSWAADVAPEGAVSAPAAPATRPAILVVEDNPDMRQYLVKLLAPHYDVEAARDGEAALKAALSRPPALVLSDVIMPGLDGMALLRALRSHPLTHAVPVVLLSAQAGDEVVLEGLGGGADDYLRKPFSARELLARVRTHVELARARREAAESQMKDSFLGIASHELRTPLTALKLGVQYLERKYGGSDSPLAARLALCDRAIGRMQVLIDDMLSVSAIKSGHLSLKRQQTDLVATCMAAAQELDLVTTLPVTLDLPSEPLFGNVDEDRVLQVVHNLLSNARKYSPPDRPVILQLRRHGDMAHLAVIDQGPGIPHEQLAGLFQRFHRVPGISVQSGAQTGLGLGLYICKAIVEQHHGRIWVDSEPGLGSTFHVLLPLLPPGATALTEPSERHA